MVEKFVPDDVSRTGTVCNEEQPENIPVKFVPDDVFNAGTVCNEEQPKKR